MDSGIRIKVECADCDGLAAALISKSFVANVFHSILVRSRDGGLGLFIEVIIYISLAWVLFSSW